MKLENEIITKKRNYGIDLLRLVAMFYILVLHTLGGGGVLDASVTGTPQFAFSWFLEIIAICAVDIFALISGYVSYSDNPKKINYSNYVMLWLEVVAYGVVINLIGKAILPEAVTKKDLYMSVLPVTNGLYWYFTAYTALFVVMPLLNIAVRKCPKSALKVIFVISIAAFSVYDTFANRFSLVKGYSFAWIAILYVLGAIIKKCDIGANKKSLWLILGIILMVLIAWSWRMWGPEVEILKVKINKNLFSSVSAPTTLIASVMYVILFSRLKTGKVFRKIISFAAPGAFAIYLINNHQFIWKNYITQKFAFLGTENIWIILLTVVGFCSLFLVASVLIDKVRALLFKWLRIRKAVDFIVGKAEKAVKKISARL